MKNIESSQMRMTVGEGVAQASDRLLDVLERGIDRLRPNVIIIALLVYYLIKDFGDKLINQIPEETSSDVIITILTALISVGVGGLLGAMMRMFESPSIPADVFERIMRDVNSSQK